MPCRLSIFHLIKLFIFIFLFFSSTRFSIAAKSNGLTADNCDDQQPCADNYRCQCSSSDGCFCFPLSGINENCKNDSDCPDGEVCVNSCLSETSFVVQQSRTENSNDSSNKPNRPAPSVSPNNGKAGDSSSSSSSNRNNVCIAIHHLESLESNQLVYSQHQQANVLCDNDYNCATPGHIVIWKGQGMMMSRYCEKYATSCKKMSMKVNSPRLSKGRRISSYSKDLIFTPLSARYTTKAEEMILTTLVRFGL